MADRFGNPERGTGNPLGSGKKKGIGKWGGIRGGNNSRSLGPSDMGVVWQHGYC
jgi:hypothetical protein